MKVNTNIRKVRDEVPSSLTGIITYLRSKGWGLTLQSHDSVSESNQQRLTIHKETWMGFPVPSYEFHYLTKGNDESAVIGCARRIAELALRLNETFKDTFPASYVDKGGYISDDNERLLLSRKGVGEILQHAIDASKQQSSPESGISFERGFLSLTANSTSILISGDDARSILRGLREQVEIKQA
ncbi:MAG: hypothetical protein CBC55_04640 [Gammaproteobacteria bacterium TMED95]|nr:MAG: hypothetical protein CBC55_04640 [Gammaproteobacteria bacterium TMED95]|tara:strand:+ start:5670 stop:6224 length:555 start_codon:yes stop_codon:yes gene_type:complete